MIWMYLRAGVRFQLGRELAQLGDDAALEHAAALAEHKRTEPQACSVRLLYALAIGDHETASTQRRQRAIAALASRHEDQRLTASYLAEIDLLDGCGDLLALQHLATWFEARAKQFSGFVPFAAYARACCHLLCGEVSEAHRLVDPLVHTTAPFTHAAWYVLRSLRAEVALLSGQASLARELALQVLQAVTDSGRDIRPHTRAVRVAVLACVALGSQQEARAVLQPWLDDVPLVPAPTTVYAGQLIELSARIALMAGDRQAFWQHYAQVQAIYGRYKNPGLMARLARLTAYATQSQATRAPDAAAVASQSALGRLCPSEQLDQVLALLVRDAAAISGHLYDVAPNGQTRWLGSSDALPSDAALDAQVTQYAAKLVGCESERTQSVSAQTALSIAHSLPDGTAEHFCVAVLRGSDDKVYGLALLRGAAGTLAVPQTRGLCTVVADVLAKAGS
jgi:hypothetical protein